MNTWILIANASEARLYSTKNPHDAQFKQPEKEYHHPQSRRKVLELISERHGDFTGNGRQHGAFEETNPKDVEAKKFAHLLATDIKMKHNTHEDDRLIIVAPPHFYGLLKQQLNNHFPARAIQKDYTKLSEKKLKAQLEHELWG